MQKRAPQTEDLRVFREVSRLGSFVEAAKAMGVSPAYVTKRIRLLEANLCCTLLHRGTRGVTLTADGDRVLPWAQRMLDDLDHLIQDLDMERGVPQGTVRICTSLGIGRRLVAPALSRLVARHPALKIRLEVFDRLVDVAAEDFDLDIRVGDSIAPHLIAQRLGSNHRILCAAPSYLKRRGVPETWADLDSHDCLIIKERDHPFGLWRLESAGEERCVKVSGPLATNHGEVATQWTLDGHGIALRSRWEAQEHLDTGALVQVLPSYRQIANIWAVYSSRLDTSAKVRVCVEWLSDAMAHLREGDA